MSTEDCQNDIIINMQPKRYYSFHQYLKDNLPSMPNGRSVKVYKIPIDAGFTCPNRDGKVGSGGCIYCSNRSFSPYTQLAERLPLREQIIQGMDFYQKHYGAEKFIIYFQAFTNTYAPLEYLKQLYDEALTFNNVIGLAIGTRPDCVSDEVLDLITEYASKYLVWLEYGIQSIHDRTLKLVNRGHTYQDFVEAVKRTQGRNIKIGTHIIMGLPGETRDDMIATAETIGALGLDGIKIHHLYIAENTPLAEWYKEGRVKTMSLEEYILLVCDVLEHLPEKMVIQRLMGELWDKSVIAPRWAVRDKNDIIAAIENELDQRGSYQGRWFPKCKTCLSQSSLSHRDLDQYRLPTDDPYDIIPDGV